MAIQGSNGQGYYGKLGMSVGQRWKNKRTIRVYVIPTNPRTPTQQLNRSKFADAVPFAQLGQQINWKTPAYDTTKNTEWAYRMSQSKIAVQNGLTDLDCVPIVPDNFASDYTITTFTIKKIVQNDYIIAEIDGTIPEGQKKYGIAFYFKDGSKENTIQVLQGQSELADNKQIKITCHDTTCFDATNIFIKMSSNDDVSATTVTYSAKIQAVIDTERPFELELATPSINKATPTLLGVAWQTNILNADGATVTTGNITFVGTVIATNKDGTTTTLSTTIETAMLINGSTYKTLSIAVGVPFNQETQKSYTLNGVFKINGMSVNAEGYLPTVVTDFTTAVVSTTVDSKQAEWEAQEGTPSYSTNYDGTMQITIPVTNWTSDTQGTVTATLASWGGDVKTKQAVELSQDETTATSTSATSFQFEIKSQTFDTATKSLIVVIDSVNKAEINNYGEVYFSLTRTYTNVYDTETKPSTEDVSSLLIPEIQYWQNATTSSLGMATLQSAVAESDALSIRIVPTNMPTESTSPTYKAWFNNASLQNNTSSNVKQIPDVENVDYYELTADGYFGGVDPTLIAYAYDEDGNQIPWTVGATAKITSMQLLKTKESYSGYTASGRWSKGVISAILQAGQTTIN